MPEEKVVSLAAFRTIQGSKIAAPEAPTAEEPPEVDYQACVVEALENALAAAKAGEYNEVFIIVREAETQEVDFWYSTTTDLEKLRLLRAADSWLVDPEPEE